MIFLLHEVDTPPSTDSIDVLGVGASGRVAGLVTFCSVILADHEEMATWELPFSVVHPQGCICAKSVQHSYTRYLNGIIVPTAG